MRDLALYALFSLALAVIVVPLFLRWCDRKMTQHRFPVKKRPREFSAETKKSAECVLTPQVTPQESASSKQPSIWSHADCLDALSRSARHNATATDALLLLPHHVPGVFQSVVSSIRALHTAPDALTAATSTATSEDDRTTLWLLNAALVHGFFVPQALDRGAVVLREIATARGELAVASAQSRLSARILTFIPLGLAGFAALVSDAARNSMFGSANGFTALCVGLGLSWLGWRWIHRLIAKVNNDPLDHAALIAVIDLFAVSVRAGLTVSQTFDRIALLAPDSIKASCEEVSRSLGHGVPLHDAIHPLRKALGSRGAVFLDMVLSADRDGLPLLALVDRLSEEARRQRQRDTDIRVRQVPARLTMPLVFCILPAFVVLTMFPIVSSSLASLQLPFSDTAIIHSID